LPTEVGQLLGAELGEDPVDQAVVVQFHAEDHGGLVAVGEEQAGRALTSTTLTVRCPERLARFTHRRATR
jgi:hypothetical protein